MNKKHVDMDVIYAILQFNSYYHLSGYFIHICTFIQYRDPVLFKGLFFFSYSENLSAARESMTKIITTSRLSRSSVV